MQFTYSNANFFLGWYIWFCPLRREDKSWALVERKKTFDIPNKLTQNLTPNRYAYSNTQFKSSYTLHPQKHRQHAQGAHGGYKKERDQIRTHTGGFRENPHGVGFYFLLASAENSEKKPISYRFFQKHRGFFIIEKNVWGVGFYFLLASAQKGEKKTPPPWGFSRESPVVDHLKDDLAAGEKIFFVI